MLNSDERGSEAEFRVFHIMSRILEAANGMCMPLPPGKCYVLLLYCISIPPRRIQVVACMSG